MALQDVTIFTLTVSIVLIIVILPLLIYYRKKSKDLNEECSREKMELREEYSKLEQTSNEYVNLAKLLQKIKTIRYDELIKRTWDELRSGIIKLTMDDYIRFWTELHGAKDIIFFRCTSRIDPYLWETKELKLYQQRQVENVESYMAKSEKVKRDIAERIAGLWDEMNIEFHQDKETNFGRIFIFDKNRISEAESLKALVSTINAQGKSFNVKAICINEREIPLLDRPQDFGIVISEKGDILLMHLEVTPDGEAGGGRIIFDKEIISRFIDVFNKIEEKCVSDGVLFPTNKKRTAKEIMNAIQELKPVSIFGENRCLKCLENAENVVDKEGWREVLEKKPLERDKKMWYEILEAENKTIDEIVERLRPHFSLEIGCGPGRVVRRILSASNKEGFPVERVVAFEQNDEIYRYTLSKFITHPQVLIQHQLFSNSGASIPYENDFFNLAIGVSNIVGWQENEVNWITEVCRVSENFFFTVYRQGCEDERYRMYQALSCPASYRNGNIELQLVDAFSGKAHVTKSYEKEDVRGFAETVCKHYNGSTFDVFDVGDYMIGCLITKKT